MTSTTRTVYTARAVRDALKALLLGWVLMVFVNTLLFRFSYSPGPFAATMAQEIHDPDVTSSLRAPIYIKKIDTGVYTFGEYQLVFFTNDKESHVVGSEVSRYRFGFPIRSFEYELYRSMNTDGSVESKDVGGFLIQGKYVPLMPNGLELVIPYGWSHNPVLYILNTVAWAAFAYAVLIVNTRMRLNIHRRRKHKRMKKQRRCVNCGYRVGDFTACPECGADQSQ